MREQRDLWNIKESYTSSAVIAKTYYLKQKPNETGRHLTISPYGWDLYITCQITLWSAVFILGLSTFNIMLAIIISALFIAAAMVMNGAAGSKYGVPFAMILRGSYGVRGALFPGLLRGGIAAIMWFGLQCYAGSLAFLILIGKIWPGFLTLGGDFKLLGLSLPGLITFLIFGLLTLASVLAVVKY